MRLQAAIRGFLARKWWPVKALKAATLAVQPVIRGFIARRRAKAMEASAARMRNALMAQVTPVVVSHTYICTSVVAHASLCRCACIPTLLRADEEWMCVWMYGRPKKRSLRYSRRKCEVTMPGDATPQHLLSETCVCLSDVTSL